MQKVLVTGINGFLAKHLAAELHSDNYILIGLARTQTLSILYQKIYSDENELILNEPYFDFIFHLSSFIPYGATHLPNIQFIDDNILLTTKLVKAYPKTRFVFSSSVSVYGIPIENKIHLKSPFNQPDYYGLSKLAGEAVVVNHSNSVIIRFSSIIGPAMRLVSFIPKIVHQAKSLGTITLRGDGARLQNYVDVRDAARLCLFMASTKYKGTILGVGYKSISNLEVAKVIEQFTLCSIEFVGEDHSPSYQYATDKMMTEMGFEFQYPIDKTIKDILTHEIAIN